MPEMPTDPPIIYVWGDDLYFTSRIESVAEGLGCKVAWPDLLLDSDAATVVERVAALSPALIVIDMNVSTVPWLDWTLALKGDPGTSTIPIVAFGSHVNVEAMKAAKQAGIEQVVARSRFVSDLAGILTRAIPAT